MSATEPKSKNLATLCVALALMASSIEPIIVKIGYKTSATAVQLIFLKLLFGGMFILPFFRYIKKVSVSGIVEILKSSVLYSLTYILIFFSLNSISAVTLITIITTTPAIVALANQFLGKERTNTRFWIGFSLCFSGVLLTIDFLKADTYVVQWHGLLLAFGSVITSTLYRIRMDDLTRIYEPLSVSTYLFLINTVLALLLFPWIGDVPHSAWPMGVWIGFAGAIANIAFLFAIRLVGSTRISILTVLQRPLVIVTAAIVLKEPLNLYQIIGVGLVLWGIQLAKISKPQKLDTSLKHSLVSENLRLAEKAT